MIAITMKARPILAPLIATGILASCSAPRTSQGFIDTDGDGLAEKVTVLEQAPDRQKVLLHLLKIKVSEQILDTARTGRQSIQSLYDAGRVGSDRLMESETNVARATIGLIDARLALARAGLLSSQEPTTLDTDGDGLPDMIHTPIKMDELLQQKLALSNQLYEQCKLGHARAEQLYKAGTCSMEEVHEAARQMYVAKLAWLDARMECAK